MNSIHGNASLENQRDLRRQFVIMAILAVAGAVALARHFTSAGVQRRGREAADKPAAKHVVEMMLFHGSLLDVFLAEVVPCSGCRPSNWAARTGQSVQRPSTPHSANCCQRRSASSRGKPWISGEIAY